MLEIVNISAKADDFILKDISLSVETGKCHVILGPTGAGKTLLLEIITGIRKNIKGEIILNGNNISNLQPENRNISYVPQDLCLFPHLTVKQNIEYGLRFKKNNRNNNFSLNELVEISGIKDLLNRSVNNLSGGEKQRVALLRALMPGNNLLIVDEPLMALHESLKRELWLLFKKIKEDFGITVIMVTHDMSEAFFLADTISVIIDGTLMQTGTKEQVYNNPATIDVARFFGINNIFNVIVKSAKDNEVNVYSTTLFTELVLSNHNNNYIVGNEYHCGIRPENIMIIRKGFEPYKQKNIIEGIVKTVFPAGNDYSVQIALINSDEVFDINMPAYAFYKLSLITGDKVHLNLKSEDIFILN